MDTELIPNSAKILAHLMIDDPQLRTYADIGNKAFGHRSRFFCFFPILSRAVRGRVRLNLRLYQCGF